MIIRLANEGDAKSIYKVEQDCFSVPWSKEAIEHDLADIERTLYVVIEENEKIIGYAGAWLVADEGQITNIAVMKEHRREGYGAMLTKKLIKEIWKADMAEIFLEVRVSNIAALSLYRRLGFTVKGIRKDYYTEPKENAYIMSLVNNSTEEEK